MSLLEIRNLKKTYLSPDGERKLVVDIPIFVIEKGEHFAVYGNSGTGKTTFLNLIAGITIPDSGSIVLNGQELTLLSEHQRDVIRGKRIGYIYQTFNLLAQYTAIENIMLAMMLGGNPDRDRAVYLMEQVDLGDKLDYKPDQLSAGQRQRVAVARALANNPDIVLADEPTGNLDIRTAVMAADLLKEICGINSSSLILMSHDMNILGRFASKYRYESINNAITMKQGI